MDIISEKLDLTEKYQADLGKEVDQKKYSGDINDYVFSNAWGEAPPVGKAIDYLSSAKGWVYACQSVIADEIAQIELRLFKKKKGKDEVEEVFDHPVLDLLNKANSFTTKFDLFWLTAQYLESVGEAPWFIAIKQGVPTDILLLRPDLLNVKEGKDNEMVVSGYEYRLGTKTIAIEPHEVVFIKYPAPLNFYRGKGTVEAAAKTIDIDNFSEDYNKNFFYNAAVPSSVMETDQKLTDQQRNRLQKSIQQVYSGKQNAHKTMLLEKGLKWKPLSSSQRDMEFLEQQKFTRDKILGIFRVPRTALGITDDVNRANAEATDYVFAKRTIKPKMKRIIDQLNEFLLPLYADGDELYLDFVDPVPEDVESKLKIYDNATKNFWMSVNEIRAREGLDDVGEDGDKLYQPFNLAPLGASSVPVTDTSKILRQIKRRNKTSIVAVENKERNEKITEQIVSAVKSDMIKQTKKKESEYRQLSNDKKHAFWHMFVNKALKEEKFFITRMDEVFKKQRDEVLNKLDKKAVDPAQFLINEDENTNLMVRVFTPLETSTIETHGQDALDLLALEKKFLVDRSIKKFIQERVFDFSEEITKETNKKLGKALAEGIEAGEGTATLKKRVSQLFASFEKYRSERIARSEVIRASNYGTEAGYEQSGVVEAKEWLTALDERNCQWCARLNGKKIKLGDNYFDKGDSYVGADGDKIDLDYENIQAPPLHPNCRCSLIPIVK